MKVGIIGWRGMVGSVLMERMLTEHDLDGLDVHFFTTSNVGGEGPDVGAGKTILTDASDTKTLSAMDVAITGMPCAKASGILMRLPPPARSGTSIARHES